MPTIDQEKIDALRESLGTDDYHLDVAVDGDTATATITAGPEACADCLVPKELFTQMLAPAVGLTPDRISVTYPDPADIPH